MNNEKYLVFAGRNYYPYGGWEDFKGIFNTIEDAQKSFENESENYYNEWAHIVKDGKIIFEGFLNWGKYPRKWQFDEVKGKNA